MDSDTGRIYEDLEKALQETGSRNNDNKRFIEFEVGERIEIKGCLFKIKSVHVDPINIIVLEALPKLIGLKEAKDGEQ